MLATGGKVPITCEVRASSHFRTIYISNFSTTPAISSTHAPYNFSLVAESTRQYPTMTSGRDVRDILGLPVGGDPQKTSTQRKPKPAATVRRIRTFWLYPSEHSERMDRLS